MAGHDLTALAERFGTPLYVSNLQRVRDVSLRFQRAFAAYPAGTRVCFSYKTNLVRGVIKTLHETGLGAEVIDGFELWLAQQLGVPGDDIIFNGPNKTNEELHAALNANVGLLVVDGLSEMTRAEALARTAGRVIRVGLRICPDVVPKGMNASSVTGSRRNQFGFDVESADFARALQLAATSAHVQLRGIHAHIGSGIHDLAAFEKATLRVLAVHKRALSAGAKPDLIDLGGGLGASHAREFTSAQMLWYLATGNLPAPARPPPGDFVERYAQTLVETLGRGARQLGVALPTLVLEPGRTLVSDSQVLLLRVGTVKQRRGVGRFALVDGGAMSVSMMFLSEQHAVLLCNRDGVVDGKVNVFGRVPSPMDVVYRSLPLPQLQEGDLLAVMDAGAYFTSTSTNFGGPRAPVVGLDGEHVTVLRRRESHEDLVRLDEEA